MSVCCGTHTQPQQPSLLRGTYSLLWSCSLLMFRPHSSPPSDKPKTLFVVVLALIRRHYLVRGHRTGSKTLERTIPQENEKCV